MGSLVGHVTTGFAFFLIGLWHLFNHVKIHATHPNSYKSSPWFRSPSVKYLELYLIILLSILSIAMELFIGPERHQPFDPDGSIPSNHLHNFEHSSISMSLIIYATFAILLDKSRLKSATHDGLTYLLGAFAFGQQFVLFHLHSADHTAVEGQYHLLLQLVIFISFLTTLMGIAYPKSFLLSFVRSLSVLFQGVWFTFMGCMLWIPVFVAQGCFMNSEDDHLVVRCSGEHTLHRAKALVNLQFSWILSMIVVLSMTLYITMGNIYGGKIEYLSINKSDVYDEERIHPEVELQKKISFSPET
ncbi:hypothetical protein MKW94_000189 [Papaver nudicaule]|uniref:Transmembrane protein 45A n=1 Tax=Papaver nudicaule TaxID=74823 RepID=A0AA41V5P6_PAPNU|nr:hypothetical protein [Papaver nudicaule]MCL7038739.1 hypothetical protein [Papaver nudicaule]